MFQSLRNGLENRKVRRTFKVQNPPSLLGLNEVLEANAL
jgi:hypothetical protein